MAAGWRAAEAVTSTKAVVAEDQEVQVGARLRTTTEEAEEVPVPAVEVEEVWTGRRLQAATLAAHSGFRYSILVKEALAEWEGLTAYACVETAEIARAETEAAVTAVSPRIQPTDCRTMEVAAGCCRMRVVGVRIRMITDLGMSSADDRV